MRIRLVLSAGFVALVVTLVFVLSPSHPVEAPAQVPHPTATPARAPARSPSRTNAPGVAGAVLTGKGRVQGHVLLHGTPARATVELWRVYSTPPKDSLTPGKLAGDKVPVSRAVTAADGSFSFERLPFQEFEIRAFAAGGRPRSVYDRPTLIQPVVEVTIELAPKPVARHELEGVAVWADGKPFHGLVDCARPGDPYDLPFEKSAGKTDDDGRFVFDGLAAGRFALRVLAPGRFAGSGPVVTVPFYGEFRYVVDQGISWLTGQVLDAGKGTPVAGAEVRAMLWRDPQTAGGPIDTGSTTGKDGRFRAPWPGMNLELRVRADGFTPVRQAFQQKPGSLVVRLHRPVTVSGRVVTADDHTPVAGIGVFWFPVGDDAPSDLRGEAVSGKDGRFELKGVPLGRTGFYAFGKGWVSKEAVDAATIQKADIAVGANKELGLDAFSREVGPAMPGSIDLTVVRCASARGQVLDVHGSPAPGVKITAYAKLWIRGPLDSMFRRQTVSGKEGRFSFEHILPGARYWFMASPAKAPLSTSGPVRAQSGKHIDVEVRLAPSRWLEVTVVAKGTQKPIGGAEIRAAAKGVWKTDRTGRARIGPLPPGPGSLMVEARGYGAPYPFPEFAAGATQIRVALSRVLTIAGRAVLPDGSPASKGQVEASPLPAPGGSPSGPSGPFGCRWTAPLERDGGFSISQLTAGKYRLKVTADSPTGPCSASEEVDAGTRNLVVKLEGGAGGGSGAMILDLLDREGHAVIQAQVFVFVGDREVEPDVQNGRVWIPLGAEPGPVRYDISQARTGTGGIALGAVRGGPLPPKAGEVQVELPPEEVIRGKVFGPDGSGISGVEVEASPRPRSDFPISYTHASATTDASGAFRLGQLGDMTYRIGIRTPPGCAPAPSLEVSAGSTGVDFHLTRGVSAVVTVLDKDGAPLEGAEVQVQSGTASSPAAKTIRKAVTGKDGAARIAGLDSSATYRIVVFRETKPRFWVQVAQLSDWTPTDTTIRLK